MKSIHFTKMTGAGNDFILFDNRDNIFSGNENYLFARLCERRKGIGADGLILVEHGLTTPVKMRYFNADGNQASMCGNGARCTAQYAFLNGWVSSAAFELESDEGMHSVKIDMKKVALTMLPPYMFVPKPGILTDTSWKEGGSINTGVPHYVIFVPDVNDIDVSRIAPYYRHHKSFPQGVNVNFVSKVDKGLEIRTFERGVEAETLACGTGCVAAALLASYGLEIVSPVDISTRGGELQVSFDPQWENITLIGPAVIVYRGIIDAAILAETI
ncbi:diaminopimelate epimerase [bacterium]|nr:diaminopimelate epimerase [bacterium]